VITGTRSFQLSSKPVRPLPMEIAQIHEAVASLLSWA
jgi:hypothetical protein